MVPNGVRRFGAPLTVKCVCELGREVARFSEAFTIEVVIVMRFDARAVSGWQSVLPHDIDFVAIFAKVCDLGQRIALIGRAPARPRTAISRGPTFLVRTSYLLSESERKKRTHDGEPLINKLFAFSRSKYLLGI